MLLVNSHKFKTATSTPGREYNRRAAIIEDLRAGRSTDAVDVKINRNRRNDRWLAHNPKDVPIIARTKCPVNVHVLGVVSSEGDVMPLHFFKNKETVTKEVYVNVLANVVKSWMETVASGRPYVFQQNSSHESFGPKFSDNIDMLCIQGILAS